MLKTDVFNRQHNRDHLFFDGNKDTKSEKFKTHTLTKTIENKGVGDDKGVKKRVQCIFIRKDLNSMTFDVRGAL